MKRMIRASKSDRKVIFEDKLFSFVVDEGIGVNNTPWRGLKVVSKGLAKKHIVEIRLNLSNSPDFDGEPVFYTYSDCYISYGLRMQSDTLEETADFINVLEDAIDFANHINRWLISYRGGEILYDDMDTEDDLEELGEEDYRI